MSRFTHILCPVDFSDTSQHALDHAAAIAHRDQARLTVLYVFANLPSMDVPPLVLSPADRERIRVDLQRMCANVPKAISVDLVVREAERVYRTILEQQNGFGADLLVLGTHGRSGFQHMVLGSITEKVIRAVKCPTLVVPPRAPDIAPDATPRLRRILCPIDFSASSTNAFAEARRMAEETGARLTALAVVDIAYETIGTAIAEGRLVFENIRRFAFYLFSCNLAEIIVLLGTSAAGWPLPLAPIQVLWLNLVTDSVPALALAVEPPRGDLMQRPPRPPTEALLARGFLYNIGLYAVSIAAPVLAVIIWQTVTGVPYERAITMNFAVLGFAQLLHLGNARDDAPVLSWCRAIANRAALIALAIGALSLVAVIQIPALAQLLRLVPLSAADWALVLGLALVPAVVGQTVKVARVWARITGVLA